MIYIITTLITAGLIAIAYTHTGWANIKACFGMWSTKEYWTSYNVVEFVSYVAKVIIIVPGLVFGVQIWWLYLISLVTSLLLIWASNKKLLPTLVGFNTVWVWLSVAVLVKSVL